MWWIIALIIVCGGGIFAYFRLRAMYKEAIRKFDNIMDALKNMIDSIVRVMIALDTDPTQDTKVETAIKIIQKAVAYLSSLDDLKEKVDAAETKEEKKAIVSEALKQAIEQVAEEQGIELTDSLLKTIDFVSDTILFFLMM